jgi:PAS domain S-box-containing protein
MEGKPLYNSRIISTFIEYIKKTRPNIDIQDLLSDSSINPYEVADEGHWFTQRQVDCFADILMKRTQDPSVFREAGRYMAASKSVSALRQFLLAFITPVQAYSMLGKILSYLDRGVTFQANKISANKIEIIITPLDGVDDKPYQCENRKGSFEAVAKLFTNKFAAIEHPVCLHEGGSHCRYAVSWEEPTFLKWRRIRNYIAIPSIVTLVVCGFLLSVGPLILLGSLMTVAIFGLSYYALYAEKRDIHTKIQQQGNTANRLLDQITIGYNNALLVQEIGQAVTSILDIDKLLKFVMETLQKRLDFDRGMIMLANPDKTRLLYVSGYGYSPQYEITLRKTQFHLDNPKSKGPFVIAFKQQEPILVSDVHHVQGEISSRSADLVETLGVSSFICVPIVYEGKSEGILAVDNYRSHRPHNQSEVSLLMGIAPQIAISINNAKSLHQIMESEERFRTLSENSPDIIYTADNKGFITYINPAASEILGYANKDIIGQHFTEFIKTDAVDTISETFERIKQGNETIKNLEGKIQTRDGRTRLFDMSGAPNLNAAGEMTGIVGTLKDVTEQRKLEYELRHASKMNALGRLTGGIAHDFNNILQAISSYNQLLTMNKAEEDPDWKYLYNINSLTKRATDLIKQLLIFSRRVESKLVPININGEIRNYYELLVSTLPKTIDMRLDLTDELQLINGDMTQLGQVIMNLAVNAKDAMSKGGELCIQTRNVKLVTPLERDNVRVKAGNYVLFRISDTGCGIERKNLDHIFEPFFTTKAGTGTGIGLSVVYGVVKSHGGHIFCVSEPGKGTIFELYFPTLDIMMVEEKKEAGNKPVLSRGDETILLVDDEPSLLETGKELLSYLGYTVLTASSGENALVTINREGENIGIVIMDLMMPGMGGEKCLTEIMKIFPSMKVMIASGNTTSVKIGSILGAGAKAFIQKPYYIEDLSNKIREILEDKGEAA